MCSGPGIFINVGAVLYVKSTLCGFGSNEVDTGRVST